MAAEGSLAKVARAEAAVAAAEGSLAKVDLERQKALVRLRAANTALRQAYKQQLLGKPVEKKDKQPVKKAKQVDHKAKQQQQPKSRRYVKTPPGWCAACWYRYNHFQGGPRHLYLAPCTKKRNSSA